MRTLVCIVIAGIAALATITIAGMLHQKPQGEAFQQVAPTRVGYEIITVDGCQYITIAGKYGFSHKGNCNNPEHKAR